MEFEGTSILKEAKGDATDVCRELPDTTGVQSVTEQDIKTLGEETAVINVHNCENDDKQRSDVSQSVTKDSENTEIVVSNIHNSENDDKQRNAVSQSAAKDGDNTEIAVNNVHNSENDDKQRNDLNQSAAKDGQNTERTKRRRRRRRRTNKPTSVDSNTDEVPNETGKSNTVVGQETEDRKKSRCSNKKKNETSAKRIDPLEKGQQKNIPDQNISDQDQHDQELLVKTNPSKDLESFSEKKRNYPEKLNNPYRGRGGTNSDSQGRGYIRGINRGRVQAFHPNRNRDRKYDEFGVEGGSDFNRGRGISDSDRDRGRPGFSSGRGTSHLIGGRGRNNFNQVRGRSEFSRSSERKEFNSGSGSPAAEDDRLDIRQPLAYKDEVYVTEPLLEKGKQTEKEHKPLFIPRKEQCACRNISNLVKSEPQSVLNIPFFGQRQSFLRVIIKSMSLPRKVGNETVIKHKIRAFFPSLKITTIVRIVENNEIATYKVVENGVKTTIVVENGVVKSQTVYCTKCGVRNTSDFAIQIRYDFSADSCYVMDTRLECSRSITEGERWTRENDIHKIRLRGRGRGGSYEPYEGSERKEFNSDSGRPYFNRGRGRGSSYEPYEGIAKYAKIHAEFKGNSYSTKVNNFADRGRTNGEFNRGRANSYSRNVGRENQRGRDSYNRRGSHTGDVRDSFVRGRGTGDFSRARGRQIFQRGRGSSYNRIEEQ